jgi:hypothetical protein
MQAWKLWGLGALWAMGAGCGGDVFIEDAPGAPCHSDNACGNHHVCVGMHDANNPNSGRCQPGCRVHSNGTHTCGNHHVCVLQPNADWGMCQPGCHPGEEGDKACGNHHVCAPQPSTGWGTCQPVAPSPCTGKDSCGDGHVCVNGTCRPACSGDDACGGNYICVDSACQPGCRPGDNNEGDDACDEHHICVNNNQGEDWGTCKLGCRLGDQGDEACGNHYICVDSQGEGFGNCEPGCRVSSTNTCGSNGYVCVGEPGAVGDAGRCEPGCYDTGDCPGNLECVTKDDGSNTPGICFEVECLIGSTEPEDSCNTGEFCVGIYSQEDDAPGICVPDGP